MTWLACLRIHCGQTCSLARWRVTLQKAQRQSVIAPQSTSRTADTALMDRHSTDESLRRSCPPPPSVLSDLGIGGSLSA